MVIKLNKSVKYVYNKCIYDKCIYDKCLYKY